MAGIIGALTNRNCIDAPYGVAGVGGGWGPVNQLPDEGMGVQLFGFKVDEDYDIDLFVANAIAAIREGSVNSPTGYGYGVHVLNNSWGAVAYSENLRAAVNYAFEHQVSFVASAGNDGKFYPENPLFPGSLDGSWVTRVGASTINGLRETYSSYGNTLDCIAPGGDIYNVNDRVVYTTAFGGGWGWFSETSAAAPHISGLISLVRSESIDRGWGIVEPEDFEGIVNASSKTRVGEAYLYLQKYNKETGWGNADAGRVFEMFSNGYRVYHFASDAEDLQFGGWSGYINFAFFRDGRFFKPFAGGDPYMVKRREVTAEIAIPIGNLVQTEDRKVFVWARSGASDLGGWSRANPNYQTTYTEIADGVYGSDVAGVAGIFLEDNRNTVLCRTYQYHVYNKLGQDLGIYPPDEDIKLFLTVYAVSAPTDVQVVERGSTPASIDPNPARDFVRVRLEGMESERFDIVVTDILGNAVLSRSGIAPEEGADVILETGLWSPGPYFVRVTSGLLVQSGKFVVHP